MLHGQCQSHSLFVGLALQAHGKTTFVMESSASVADSWAQTDRSTCLQAARAEAKELIFDNESRRRMQNGINKLADAVGVRIFLLDAHSACPFHSVQ